MQIFSTFGFSSMVWPIDNRFGVVYKVVQLKIIVKLFGTSNNKDITIKDLNLKIINPIQS